MASSSCSPPSAAVSHLSKGYERLTQLRALLLSSSPEKPGAVAPTISLLDEALRCLAAAMSKLQACPPFPIPSTGVKDGKKETSSPKRRKIQSWTLVTSVPHFDGHQWRKYGQKHIDGAEFPRSYFKCTYRKDQGCPATKTVQRTEGGDSDSPNYEVRYRMQHTCKAMEADGFPFVMDSSTVINRNKTPDCSHELSTSGAPAASPEHSFPALLPLQDDGGIYDFSLWDQVPLPEPPLNPASVELGEEENGGGGSSSNPSPSLGELDFDWAWLMSWSSSADLDES